MKLQLAKQAVEIAIEKSEEDAIKLFYIFKTNPS